MEQFSQNPCWTLPEDLKPLRGHERAPCNQVRKEKREGEQDGTCTPGGGSVGQEEMFPGDEAT